MSLAFTGPQAAPQLLKKDDFRFGRSKHDDAIDGGDVQAFVEHVDNAQVLKLAGTQSVK